MGIVAAYDKTIFYNPANRYAVLRLKTADIMIPEEARSPYKFSDHLIRFTAVGYDLPRTDTVKVELEGQWVSGKFGPQLQVERWKEIAPATVEGIRNYLASGLLKCIGAKTADAIVERFGLSTLDVLEQSPEASPRSPPRTEPQLALHHRPLLQQNFGFFHLFSGMWRL